MVDWCVFGRHSTDAIKILRGLTTKFYMLDVQYIYTYEKMYKIAGTVFMI